MAARPSKTAPRGRPRKPVLAKKSKALSIRVRADLHDALNVAAAAKGRSLSAEISYRLEAALHEEKVWGGRQERELAQLMAVRFISAGQQAGELSIGAAVKAEQWLTDPHAYNEALLSVVATLWARRPGNPNIEDGALWFESLKGRLMAALVNRQKGRTE